MAHAKRSDAATIARPPQRPPTTRTRRLRVVRPRNRLRREKLPVPLQGIHRVGVAVGVLHQEVDFLHRKRASQLQLARDRVDRFDIAWLGHEELRALEPRVVVYGALWLQGLQLLPHARCTSEIFGRKLVGRRFVCRLEQKQGGEAGMQANQQVLSFAGGSPLQQGRGRFKGGLTR
jgi:hypothetical protein